MEEDLLFSKVDIGPGIILSYNDSSFFYGLSYNAFNRFAMEMARSTLYLGDLSDERQRAQKRVDSVAELGYDMSDIDMEMQARYTKIMEDCLEKFVSIVTTMVENQYTKTNIIKRI